MVKWNVNFEEEANNFQGVIKRTVPLEVMKLNNADLGKHFVIRPGGNKSYTSRELIFKFYENDNCKILYLTGDYSIAYIMDLLLELPPVFILHVELSLIKEKFTNLSRLNILNAIYAIDIDKNGSKSLFWANLYKVVEEGLQFYWV